MEKLDYDVAREFIKTGKRIDPKDHPLSWYGQDHTTKIMHIGKYNLWCYYNSLWLPTVKDVTVYIANHYGKIPFDIANAIYEKFKDENNDKPIFEYNGGYSYDPSLLIVFHENLFNEKDLLDFNKSKDLKVDYIRLYSMEELEFAVELLKSVEKS